MRERAGAWPTIGTGVVVPPPPFDGWIAAHGSSFEWSAGRVRLNVDAPGELLVDDIPVIRARPGWGGTALHEEFERFRGGVG